MPVNESLWGKIGYEPHSPEQRAFHESLARFKIPACGRRFGKSRMAAAEIEPYLFQPEAPGRGWIVAPSYDTADEFQYIWDDVIVAMGLGSKVKCANNTRTGEMYIEMPWGDKVEVKSAKYPHTLVGKGLKWVILSEAAKLPHIVWKKYIRPALADRRGPAIMPSTPEGFNWYKELHDRGLPYNRERYPEWESWNFPSWSNPVVYPGGFEDQEVQSQMVSQVPEEDPWFWQELGAQFRAIAGMVYPEFDDQVHVKQHQYDPGLPNFVFMDFGFTNPTVALDVQITPSDEVYIWREYYRAGLPPHIHAEELNQRPQPEGYKINCMFGDSADAGAVDTYGRLVAPMIALTDAKDVVRGIQEVKKMLRPPRLFIDPSCEQTIQEFRNYRVRSSRDALMDQANAKEEPQKVNDHAMDAIRYGIMHHFVIGAWNNLSDIADLVGKTEGGIFKGGDTPAFNMEMGVF